ncbi:Phosphate regulon sensor protein PhoR [Wohlfahrtiimonas chitiniclastica SH04]|uniref:Phosphate regulon sensor protein PhoR n=1 Tax=Wohlfahrtiimonas chitiniclastica SH04 TaxID=1261130 RepID=L8XU82_9GAMM|nr:phosphate regulon sensor histidine kinase PhoR [Wohlfahrtiimonas chitiniclastica]ELV07568.1 Phosphate regulon sensor protein PhoR [Wohlfahrtiimonas chitiniclastica SH04]
MMLKQTFLKRFLLELFLTLLLCGVIGLLFGHFLLGLLVGFVGLVCWHCYHLFRLSRWIWQKNALYPPESFGSWEIIYYGLHKHQQRLRSRQNELAQIIRLFRHGVDTSPDALMIVDDAGNIQWCNQRVKTQLNIRWPDDKGQNIVNLIRDPALADYLQQEDFSEPLTLKIHQKHYMEFRVLPYEHSRHIIVARNVNDIYLAQLQRKDFFTHASHELRTPLSVVKGYVEMFEEDLVPEDQKAQTWQKVQSQIERMESLIGQILLLSKIENMSAHAVMHRINVAKLLDQWISSIIEVHPDYEIVANIEANLSIMGHQDQLYSVMCNLIDNAIKHNPSGTKIQITWARASKGVLFSVQDNGVGIAGHHLNRLTERFYQVDSAHTHQKNSSGLGLAIVKHALRHHGCDLSIESFPNRGSTFSFVIPAHLIVE